MTAIPAKSSFTGASVTEGGFKTSLEGMHDYLTEQIGSAGGLTLQHGGVRLEYVSATQVTLLPHNGSRLLVKVGSTWSLRTIAEAGISANNTNVHVDGASGQNLAASTLYYLYIFDDSGTLKPDFSATGPARDADTGVWIKTGVPTRTLVASLMTDGSAQFRAFHVLSQHHPAWRGDEPLSSGVVAAAGSWSITGLVPLHRAYRIVITDLLPASDGDTFLCRMSANNGSSFIASAGAYWHARIAHSVSGSPAGGGSNSDTEIELLAGVGNDAGVGEEASLELLLYEPTFANDQSRVTWQGGYRAQSGNATTVSGFGARSSSGAEDAIQFAFSAGNVATARWALYGLRA